MQHVIVRIGRPVVHGEGWYGEATGRIVIQDMLSEGSGEHVLWSPDCGGKNHLRSGDDPKGRVYGLYWRGEDPSPVRNILMSWNWLTLVSARFCPYSASNRVRSRSFSSRNRFVCSCNLAICRACSSFFASISWSQRRNRSSRAWFTGLLVKAVNSNDLMGCLGIAKALEI